MANLHLRWSARPDDTGPSPDDDDLVLVFAPAAAPSATRARVLFADDLLDWHARAAIEVQVGELLSGVRDAAVNDDVLDACEFELRVEWINVLCAHAAAQAVQADGPFSKLLASALAPASIVAGVGAALDLAPSPAPQWRLELPFRGGVGWRGSAARTIVAARAAATRRGPVRVLAFPGQRLTQALSRLSPGQVRKLGLAVAALPEFAHGEAARLVLSHRLPALRLDTAIPTARSLEPDANAAVAGRITDDERLDQVLGEIADAVLQRGAQRVAAINALTPNLDALPSLRAILLPTSVLGVTRLVARWARSRGLPVAVYQHGIYGLVEGDGGDRRADVLFAWSPAVGDQAARWPPPRPRVVPTGVPDLPRAARSMPRGPPRRVLVATTNSTVGTALTTWNTREQFVDSVMGGLDTLRRAGCEVHLRLHPLETPGEYAAMDRWAGRASLALAEPGPFANVARRYDLLVSVYSSVAFEAATLGLPVALWIPSIPPAVRNSYLLPPLSEDLPGTFSDAVTWSSVATALVRGEGWDPLIALSERLAAYASPFDVDRFAAELGEL